MVKHDDLVKVYGIIQFVLSCFLFVIAPMARIDGFAGNCLPPLLIRLHANEVQRHVVAPHRNTMARSTNWNVQNNVAWTFRMNLLFSFARYIIPLQIRRTCPKLSVCLLLCWVYDSFPGQNPARVPGRIFIAPDACHDSGNAKQKIIKSKCFYVFSCIIVEYLSISHLQNQKNSLFRHISWHHHLTTSQLVVSFFLTTCFPWVSWKDVENVDEVISSELFWNLRRSWRNCGLGTNISHDEGRCITMEQGTISLIENDSNDIKHIHYIYYHHEIKITSPFQIWQNGLDDLKLRSIVYNFTTPNNNL